MKPEDETDFAEDSEVRLPSDLTASSDATEHLAADASLTVNGLDANGGQSDAVSENAGVTDTGVDDDTETHDKDNPAPTTEATKLDSDNDIEEELLGSCRGIAPDAETCTAA